MDDKLGTPDSEAGDAAETQTTGAQGTEGQGGLPAEDVQKLNLAWKVEAELERKRARDLEQRLREMETRQPTPAAGLDDPEEVAVREWVQKGDPIARRVQALPDRLKRELREEFQGMLMQQEHNRQLERIGDPAKRARVQERFEQNRHRYGDPDAAREAVEREELEAELARIRRQNEAIQRKKEEQHREAPPTHSRETPAPKTETKDMTFAQFDEQIAALESEGRYSDAMALRGQARQGKINLRQ